METITRASKVENEMRKALDQVVARAGKDKLRSGDIFALRRAIETGYAKR